MEDPTRVTAWALLLRLMILSGRILRSRDDGDGAGDEDLGLLIGLRWETSHAPALVTESATAAVILHVDDSCTGDGRSGRIDLGACDLRASVHDSMKRGVIRKKDISRSDPSMPHLMGAPNTEAALKTKVARRRVEAEEIIVELTVIN